MRACAFVLCECVHMCVCSRVLTVCAVCVLSCVFACVFVLFVCSRACVCMCAQNNLLCSCLILLVFQRETGALGKKGEGKHEAGTRVVRWGLDRKAGGQRV